ncbi:MAG TPA: DUF2950 domain-containing protein [Candidatus Acidoferrales bacterium]
MATRMRNSTGNYLRGFGGVIACAAVTICFGLVAGAAQGQAAAQQSSAGAGGPAMMRKTSAKAPVAGHQTFPSAMAASQALVAAMQSDDQQALMKVLGPDSKEIISSGDETQDKNERSDFVMKYQEMHRLVTEPDGTTTLYIGAENWPTPIPLMHAAGGWYFDTAAGKKEILYRRIGSNELNAIQVCRELVDAQKEYNAKPHDGDSTNQYAQKFFSDPDKHNGLYWTTASGEEQSPIGPLVASAEAEGYSHDANHQAQPFMGYYFRVLKAQGANAPGGAKSYLVGGKMTRGFAFVVYPAEYRSSGVMTFIVNQDGVVYEKDLGVKTAEIAKALTAYNRDATWRKAD